MSVILNVTIKENGVISDVTYQCSTEREADETQLKLLSELSARKAKFVDAYVARCR